jgi:hypothetical protein
VASASSSSPSQERFPWSSKATDIAATAVLRGRAHRGGSLVSGCGRRALPASVRIAKRCCR